MSPKVLIIIFIGGLAFYNCSSYKTMPVTQGQLIKGRILYGSTNEVMVGQGVRDFHNYNNVTTTDSIGLFEIRLQGKYAIIQLSTFYNPVYVEVSPNEFNLIIIDDTLIKKSKKLLRKVKNRDKEY